MAGGWRTTYVLTAMLSLYFNVFVAVVQSFIRIPALHALAPTQSEGPFALTQFAVLIAFLALSIVALRKFKAGTATGRHAVA